MGGLDEDVDTFRAVLGDEISRKTAEDFLRGTSNIEAAISAFFDNPDPSRFQNSHKWVEGEFGAERNGGQSQMDSLPPYQMEEDDRVSRSLRPLGALSRPPSRERSTVSLRSGRDVDMQQYGPQQQDDMDPELKEAMRLSLEDSQQTGVIGNEYVPDQSAEERRRRPEEPAFLKPLPNDNFLPTLITVLHSIPRGREALFSPHDVLDDYGYNGHWWEGETIETSRISITDENGIDSDQLDILHETQRLMAFLDRTERSYGSVGALTKLKDLRHPMYQGARNDAPFTHFLAAWQSAASKGRTDYEYDRLFEMYIGSNDGVEPEVIHGVSIPGADIPAEPSATLYDALDHHFWQGKPPAAFIHHISPVVVMQISQPDSSLRPLPGQAAQEVRLRIPAVLHSNRYMHANKDMIIAAHQKMEELKQQLEVCQKKIDNITKFQRAEPGKTGNAQNLLQWTISYLQRRSAAASLADVFQGNQPLAKDADQEKPACVLGSLQVLTRLQTVDAHLRSVVEEFEKDKARLLSLIKECSNVGICPTETTDDKPVVKFRLCGVAASTSSQSHTSYIQYIPPSTDSSAATEAADTWWRISYDTRGDRPVVSKNKVSEAAVLEAAGELHADTLLIYAADEMWTASDEPCGHVPDSLEAFVHADNESFKNELEEVKLRQSTMPVIEGQAVEHIEFADYQNAGSGFGGSTHHEFITPISAMQQGEMEEVRGSASLLKAKDDDQDSDTANVGSDTEMENC